MMGLIKYVAKVPVRIRSPYASVNFYDTYSLSQVGDVAPAGSNVDVLFDWRYSKYEPTRKDTRFTPSTPTGFVEVVTHGFKKGSSFTVDYVSERHEPEHSNDYEALISLNDHLSRGEVAFYPDHENYPLDFVHAVASKIISPKRIGSLYEWSFSFDLMEIPSSQAARVVPAFQVI